MSEENAELAVVETTPGIMVTADSPTPDWEKSVQTSSRRFLTRIQLNGSSTGAVKDALEGANINQYCVVKSATEVINLGPNPVVKLYGYRPFALDNSGDKPIGSTDPDNDVFKAIVEKAKTKNSKCQYGYQYLIYDSHTKQFHTFLLGSETARNQQGDFKPLIGKWVQLGCKIIVGKSGAGKGNKWNCPTVKESSVNGEEPDAESIQNAVKIFNVRETTGIEAPVITEGAGS
jgi:hypothetical protein